MLEAGQRKRIDVMPQVVFRAQSVELVGETDPAAFRLHDVSVGFERQLLTNAESIPLSAFLGKTQLATAVPGVVLHVEVENVSKKPQHFILKMKGDRLG